MRWLDDIIDSMDFSLSILWEIVKDREAWHTAVHRVTKSRTQLSDQTTTTQCNIALPLLSHLIYPKGRNHALSELFQT